MRVHELPFALPARKRITNLARILLSYAQVDDVLWDLERPLEKSAKLELFDFESPEGWYSSLRRWAEEQSSCKAFSLTGSLGTMFPISGKRVFWHSSAHVLGEAAERHYGCHLCIGPPTDEGFFYEMGMGLSGDR